MKALGSSDTSVTNYQSIRRNIPEAFNTFINTPVRTVLSTEYSIVYDTSLLQYVGLRSCWIEGDTDIDVPML